MNEDQIMLPESEQIVNRTESEDEERKHFLRIVNALKRYRVCSLMKIAKTEKYLTELPSHHQHLLEGYREHLRKVADCVSRNDLVIQEILKHAGNIFETAQQIPNLDDVDTGPPSVSDIDKVLATLKQFVRDWSIEGAVERAACYEPIINEIEAQFPPFRFVAKDVKVLVPGSGLGRLAFEIAKRGFSCQGNEFSLFMLMASNFVLNKCGGTNLYSICPWAAQSINVLNAEDQLKEIWFPDINPYDMPRDAEFSMAAGDFLEIYTEPESWDCVATCFFIDCAHNVVSFVETIYKILKPGGIWVNLGPLLYHFADMRCEDSIEPSYDILRSIIVKMGFEFEKEDTKVKSTYTQNPASMMKYGYESVYFVCRKPLSQHSPASR